MAWISKRKVVTVTQRLVEPQTPGAAFNIYISFSKPLPAVLPQNLNGLMNVSCEQFKFTDNGFIMVGQDLDPYQATKLAHSLAYACHLLIGYFEWA